MSNRHGWLLIVALACACAAGRGGASAARRGAVGERKGQVEHPAEALLKTVDRAVAAGPFKAGWESLQNYSVPDWYQDGKFGIFIHWGVYSVPAFGNEWYPRNMYRQDSAEFKHHVATYGAQSLFGYKEFIRNSAPRSTIPRCGRGCSRRRGRGSWCRWRSTTMGLRCMTAT